MSLSIPNSASSHVISSELKIFTWLESATSKTVVIRLLLDFIVGTIPTETSHIPKQDSQAQVSPSLGLVSIDLRKEAFALILNPTDGPDL